MLARNLCAHAGRHAGNTSGQRDTLLRAAEQYREILRLDPTDSDAALWLARLDRLQNDQEKAEGVLLRALLAREPANENGVEQLTQLLLDEGKSQEAISSLQGVSDDRAADQFPPWLWELLSDAYTQTHDLPNAEQAYLASLLKRSPATSATTRNSRKPCWPKKNFRKRWINMSASRRWIRTIPTPTCAWRRFTGR